MIFGVGLDVKSGADPHKMLEVLSTSFGGSKTLDRGVPSIRERNFGGGSPMGLIRKGLDIIHDVAESLGVSLAIGDEASGVVDRGRMQASAATT